MASKTSNIRAYAWRSGLIGFGERVPSGALPILTVDGKSFTRDQIEGAARHSYDGAQLLVPGLPEAKSDAEAMDAFERWIEWLRDPIAANLAAKAAGRLG